MEGSASSLNGDDWAGPGGGSDREPDPVAVVAALRRILDSVEGDWDRPRSRDFLAYVVTETLAGRGHRLKERTVARHALGRGKDFDAVTDAAARVQANRLRTSLERYYAGSGAAESLVVELPRGGYIPDVRAPRKPLDAQESGPLEPGLVVVQFADMPSEGDEEPMAWPFTESLINALSTFPGLRVIGPAVSERGVGVRVDAQAAAQALDAQYVLTGAVRTTPTLVRVMIRLSDGVTGKVLWSDVTDQERSEVTGFHDEDDLVRRIAATVGDFRGVMLRDTTVRRASARLPAAYAATLSYYRYLDSGTPEDTQTAERELRMALDVEPENVVLLSMLGSLEYATAILQWAPDRDVALADAERRARTALTLHPRARARVDGARGRGVHRGRADQCQADASRAIALSPSHPSILYGSGVLLALSGAWETGLECIRESNRLNPYHPWYQHVLLALDRLMVGDHTGVLAEASLLTHPEDLWGPLIRCLAFIGLGHDDRARGRAQRRPGHRAGPPRQQRGLDRRAIPRRAPRDQDHNAGTPARLARLATRSRAATGQRLNLPGSPGKSASLG